MLKPELQAKFLSHLNNRKKRNDEGFTLIELLVVVIIIGVLAAIALPSLLGQVNKAKQSEAKQNVGTVNRSQQAYFLEYSLFASSIQELQVGIKTQSDNFSYDIQNGGSSNGTAQIRAHMSPGKTGLRTYYGVVGTQVGDAATSEALTVSIACESNQPGATVSATTNFSTCDTGFKSLAR